jgi:uncharacterized membrane protein YraQ (UPF0718 family)
MTLPREAPEGESVNYRMLAGIARTLFLLTAGVVFAIVFSSYLSPGWIRNLQEGTNSFLLLVYAALVGFVLPGPRYILYPILARLAVLGLSPAIIITLICGHVLIEPSTFFIEAGFFGFRFPLKRFLASLVIALAAGVITVFVTTTLGWSIP